MLNSMGMYRTMVFWFVFSVVLSLCSCVPSAHAIGAEEIEQYNVDIDIRKSGEIVIMERLAYSFGSSTGKHGIYRDIPLTKRGDNGIVYKMAVDVGAIENEYGVPYVYELKRTSQNLRIKIGDPDVIVRGKLIYHVTYTVSGALGYFDSHDELYWNAIGTDWDVPIKQAEVVVTVPPGVRAQDTQHTCYTGVQGGVDQECSHTVQQSDVLFVSNGILHPREGMTVVLGFPKGVVATLEPEEHVPFFDTIWGISLIVIMVVLCVVWYVLLPLWLPLKWWMSGRDPYVGNPPTAWYDPPKDTKGSPLIPLEVGTLINEYLNTRDVWASVIHLAQRGYLKIVEKEEKSLFFSNKIFIFIAGKDYTRDSNVLSVEKEILNGIFGIYEKEKHVNIDSVKLYRSMSDIREKAYARMVLHHYFVENPQKVRRTYQVLMGFAVFTFNIGLLLSCYFFGLNMPRKTIRGVKAALQAKGLRNFVRSQERQLTFQARNQMMFEKLLPYAIAFGVEKEWASRFEGIPMTDPSWYVSSNNSFTTKALVHSLSNSQSSFSSATTPPSSGGSGFSGGFSGGGGGGGGGGSW